MRKKQNTTLDISGQKCSDGQTVADEFNKFFTTVAHNLANSIPSPASSPNSNMDIHDDSMLMFDLDCLEVFTTINSFKNKSSSLGSIPSYAYKQMALSITPALTKSINNSLYKGIFPYCLKHCLLYTSPSPRDKRQSRMPSSA